MYNINIKDIPYKIVGFWFLRIYYIVRVNPIILRNGYVVFYALIKILINVLYWEAFWA